MEVGKSVAKIMMGLTGLSEPGAGGGCHALPPDFDESVKPDSNRGGGAIMTTASKLPPRIIRPSYRPVLYHYYKPLTVVARIPRNLPQLYSFLRIEVK